jgi:RNase H-fold protein (predicted Holliday junction resolvase)
MINNYSAINPSEQIILGFDPGRDKCGIAVMGSDGQVDYHQVVPAAEAIATLDRLVQQYRVSLLVMGDRTTAKDWQQQINYSLPQPPPIVTVDEHYSSLEARDRYWQMYPPKGLTRLIPQGMRQPPRPVDDLVAIILIERYIANC